MNVEKSLIHFKYRAITNNTYKLQISKFNNDIYLMRKKSVSISTVQIYSVGICMEFF